MLVEENLEIGVEANDGWDPRITAIKCGELVRSYLIKTERFLLVYDTLLGPKSGAFLRERALEQAEGSALLVVNSHADWDHYFGNMMFPEPILGTHAMVDRVTTGVGEKELKQKREEFPECYGPVQLVPPSVAVRDKVTLHGGDLTIKIIRCQGHRPDHLALYIPELKTLFPGDNVEDPIPLVDEDSHDRSNTLHELIESLEEFLLLEPDWVLANHAAPEAGTGRIENNLHYLRTLRDKASESKTLDHLREEFPVDPGWDDFYQKAHTNQIKMARQQTRRQARKWADD